MKKILATIFAVFLLITSVNAKSNKVSTHDIEKVIKGSNIDKSLISVSVKDFETGKVVYQLNEKMLMHPASIQKMLTLPAFVDVLGDDYNFETKLFDRDKGDYIIQLGADPYLTNDGLKDLISPLDMEKTKRIYVDDSIIEKKDWGEGWQWDDNMNTSMPKFNSYNLDGNLLKLTLMPTELGNQVLIINPSKYPITFFNNVITGTNNTVKITKDNSVSASTLVLDGEIVSPYIIYMPTDNLRRYFNVKLTRALDDKKIYLKYSFDNDLVKNSDKNLKTVSHPLSMAINDILKNSNNMVIETVMKLSAHKKYNNTGNDVNGIAIFNQFCEKLGVDKTHVKIVDASGVSKNNLVSSDFVTSFLYLNKEDKVYDSLPHAGEGTLANRMLPIDKNLSAKTGTLSDISSLAGFLTTRNNKKYVFCIIINDPQTSSSEKKVLEDYIVREMFIKL